MMRKLTILMAGVAALAYGATAQAAVHEYFKCSVADGHSIEEVVAVANEWRTISNDAGFEDYFGEILIPIYSEDNSTGTFYWEGTAPSRARLAEASDWYAGDEAAEIRAAFDEVSTCDSGALYQIIELESATAD